MTDWIAYILVSWLVADFLSGVGHWLEDRYFRTEWPLIGKYVAAPNERHHLDPLAFTRPNYWGRNWTTFAVTLIPCLVLAIAGSRWWLALLFVSQSNEIHCWSHQRCTWCVRMLQDMGMLQSPRQHAQHHKAPFDCRYCVMTNFLNPALDACGFWLAIEQGLLWFGIHPKEPVTA